jgi:hypothetical protein
MRQNNPNSADAIREKMDRVMSRMKARLAEAQRQEDYRKRKDETRYKIIFGACLLADLANNPDLGALFEESLKRTASGRDLEFLRSKGWQI